MLDFLPGIIKGPIASILFATNTIFWCVLLYVVAIAKFVPVRSWQEGCSRVMIRIAELWISFNSLLISTIHNMSWDIRLPAQLSTDKSYLVIANHQSWVDIVAIQHVFNRKIPFIRFFLKNGLRYVPFLGVAWKALDYPFMKRYSASYLEKHPEKRGEDLAETKRACDRFKGRPVTILNFLEGTRFTEEKHSRPKNAIYQNVLSPKTGGVAFVIEAMGEQFDSILNVTIHYPDGAKSMWGLFTGQIDRIVVDVEQIKIPQDILGGGYFESKAKRERMQSWVTSLWREKDAKLGVMKTVGRS